MFRIIRDRREHSIYYMTSGNLKNMEHYREVMGNLDCLDHVEQELKSLLEKQELSDG